MTQSFDGFPIATALSLSEALGYGDDQAAMAELLPEVAIGVALALQETKKTEA